MEKLTPSEQIEFEYLLTHFNKIKERHQEELSQLSHNNRPVVVAEGSGHAIPLMQPTIIVDELRKFVDQLRR